jgi:hypothetical protein
MGWGITVIAAMRKAPASGRNWDTPWIIMATLKNLILE